MSLRLCLSNKEQMLRVVPEPPNKVIDLFSDTDCISVCRMLKQPKPGAQEKRVVLRD